MTFDQKKTRSQLSWRPAAVVDWLLSTALLIGLPIAIESAGEEPDKPKAVVLIYADDLGYGDLSCYGATKLTTPNLDRLAKRGRLFTDAHSASAVCTPSRYALLTGEYAWRIDNFSPVFAQHGLIIDTGRTTIADLFQRTGYATACIGKWHLGWGEANPDWNSELKPGPLELGFDHFYGVPVVNSHPPFVYVEDRKVVGLDPEDPLIYEKNKPNPHTQDFPMKNKRPMRNGLGFRGGKAAHDLYRDRDVSTHLTEKAVAWMESQGEKPFFLYLATTNIHHPFTPHRRFQGTSEAGEYGDFVHELDWTVGEVMATLERLGIADDSLIIFTSDNGGMLNGGGSEAWEKGHRLNGELLGFKFGAWEGGHRVPFIASWPGRIPADTTCDRLISSIDLCAAFAAMLDQDLGEEDAPDSFNILPALIEDNPKPVRNHLVIAPHQKTHLSLRRGNWVYIPARGSGGFGNGQGAFARTNGTNSDLTPEGKFVPDAPKTQLYHLGEDPYQSKNVVRENPETAGNLARKLKEIRAGERTAPLR